MNKVLNCWEYMLCGREPGGMNAKDASSVCPATRESGLHEVHRGKNAGRACWVISGTFCNESVQGTFTEKQKKCGFCDFYHIVKQEENDKFLPTIFILKILEDREPRFEERLQRGLEAEDPG